MPATEFRAAPSPHRTLVALGGIVLAVIVINGLIAVLGLYFVNERHARALSELDRLVENLETARAAEVHFKKQVQEWKNILLRGNNLADYAKYGDAFTGEQQIVREKLQTLATEEGPVSAARVRSLIQTHEDLVRRYGEALEAHPTSVIDVRAIDERVRGMDRPLTDELESLVEEVNRQVDATRAAAREADAAHYATLRTLVASATGVGAALVVILLLVARRSTSGRWR